MGQNQIVPVGGVMPDSSGIVPVGGVMGGELRPDFRSGVVADGSVLAAPNLENVLRYLSGAWKNLNPVTAIEGVGSAVMHPIDTVKSIGNAQLAEAQKALADLHAGHYSEMAGHGAAAALPILGPAASAAGERIGSGDVAGGLGEATGLLTPFVAGSAYRGVKKVTGAAVRGAVTGARAVGGADALNAVADMADRAATNRIVDVTAPKVGPNKVRLNAKMADIAPQLAREDALSALSREGLHAKVADRLAQASDAIDEANDTRLASQQVQTPPILAKIDEQISTLTAHSVDASRPIPSVTPAGLDARPTGQPVEPAPNASQIATLRQIRGEVAQLGPVAPYEAIRRIRQAWDQVAKVKYLPSTAADVLKAQGEATAASKGTGALRDALAATDPASAKAYGQYSLFKAADDVLTATQEAERARPRVGRGIMARATGAVVGAGQAGGTGAVIGAIVGGVADRAAQLAPTFQIVIARRLAAIADLLRGGEIDAATTAATRLRTSLPGTAQAAQRAPGDQGAHLSTSLPPEFAAVDAPVATPGSSPAASGTAEERMQELLRQKFGGRAP